MLDLPNEGLGNDGIAVLAEALKTNTALKELNLQWNNIGAEGIFSSFSLPFLPLPDSKSLLLHLYASSAWQ